MRSKMLTDLYYGGSVRLRRKDRFKATLNAYRSFKHQMDDFSGLGSFKCTHCGQIVSTDPLLSGVNNRNHCPYCLWSRHLDLYASGDRLSACKGRMQPVGLTLKRSRNKYARDQGGELMLVHHCTECGHYSINRSAADDDSDEIIALLDRAAALDRQTRMRLTTGGIRILTPSEYELVRERLFGCLS
jgi:DNA-directed RNA polymerase subunit RPC12/RpoP